MGKGRDRTSSQIVLLLLLTTLLCTGALAYTGEVRNADGTKTLTISAAPEKTEEEALKPVASEFYNLGYRNMYGTSSYQLYFMEEYGTLPILLYLPTTEEKIRFKLIKAGYLGTPTSAPVWYTLDPSRQDITYGNYTLTINDVFHGLDIIYRMGENSVAEYLVVRQPFKEYVVDQTPPLVLQSDTSRIIFVFDVEGKAFISGEPFNSLENTRHGEIFIEKSYWHDSNVTEQKRGNVIVAYMEEGDKIIKGIKFEELRGSVLPLYIDPTLNLGESLIAADVYAGSTSNDRYGAWIRWNISSIPAGATVTSATQNLYIFSTTNSPDNDVEVYRVENQTWTETSPGTELDTLSRINMTAGTLSSITDGTTTSTSVLTQVQSDVALNNHFATIIWRDPDATIASIDDSVDNNGLNMGDIAGGGAEFFTFEDSENSLGSGNFPSLDVTYTIGLHPFISAPEQDVSRVAGELFNITCSIENNLTTTLYNSTMELGFANGSSVSIAGTLNQSDSILCGNVTNGSVCDITWELNVSDDSLEETQKECDYTYTIGKKTSTLVSDAKQFNFINLTEDFTLVLSPENTFVGSSITAQISSTITSFPYSMVFFTNDSVVIEGCAFNGTTPVTSGQTFFETCSVGDDEAVQTDAQAVFFLRESPQNNVTELFDIQNKTDPKTFFVTDFLLAEQTFLGEEFFITALVTDVNETPVVNECCFAHIEDVSTNITISVTDTEKTDELGRCRVEKTLEQGPFFIDNSYQVNMGAYECTDPDLRYDERKGGFGTASFEIISHVTLNEVTYGEGRNAVAGLDRFEATFNFTNEFGQVIKTETDCFFVDENEQDFHTDPLDGIIGTINLGTVEQTYGTIFPSFKQDGSLFDTGEYVMECLTEFKNNGEPLEIRRFRTDPFNVTASNDSVILNSLSLSSDVLAEGEIVVATSNITATKTRRGGLQVFLESTAVGKQPNYLVAEIEDFQFLQGTRSYSNQFLMKAIDGTDILDGEYDIRVLNTLEDGYVEDIFAGTLTINGTVFHIQNVSSSLTDTDACQDTNLTFNYIYFGPSVTSGEVMVEFEDINGDYFLRKDLVEVELEPGQGQLKFPVSLPYTPIDTQVEIQFTAFVIDEKGEREQVVTQFENDTLTPELNVTANLTESCFYTSRGEDLDFKLLEATRNKTLRLTTPEAINITLDNIIDYRTHWENLSDTQIAQNSVLTTIGNHLADLVMVTNDTGRFTIEALANQTAQMVTLNDHAANQTLELQNIGTILQDNLGALISATNNQTTALISVNTTLTNMSAEVQVQHIKAQEDTLLTIASLDSGNFLLNQSVGEQQTLNLKIENNTLAITAQTTNQTTGFASIATSIDSQRDTLASGLENLSVDMVNQTLTQQVSLNGIDTTLLSLVQAIDAQTVSQNATQDFLIEGVHNISLALTNQTLTQQVMVDALTAAVTDQTTMVVASLDSQTTAITEGADNITVALETLTSDQNARMDLQIEGTANVSNATLELVVSQEDLLLELQNLNGSIAENLASIKDRLEEQTVSLNASLGIIAEGTQNITLALTNQTLTQQVMMDAIRSAIDSQTTMVVASIDSQTTEITEGTDNITSALDAFNIAQAQRMDLLIEATANTTNATFEGVIEEEAMVLELQNLNGTIWTSLATIDGQLADIEASIIAQTTNQTQSLQGIATSIDNTTVFMQLIAEAENNVSLALTNQTLTQQVMMDLLIGAVTNQTSILVTNQENASTATILGAQNVSKELSALRETQALRYDLLIEATANTTNATLDLRPPLEDMVMEIQDLDASLVEGFADLNITLDQANTLTASQILVGQNITEVLRSLNSTQADASVSLATIATNSENQSVTLLNITDNLANWTLELSRLNTNVTDAIRNSTTTNQNFYDFVVGTLKEPIVASVRPTDFVSNDGLACEGTVFNAGINAQSLDYTLFLSNEATGNSSTAVDSASGQLTVNPGEEVSIEADLTNTYGEQYCGFEIVYGDKRQIARQRFTADQFGGGQGIDSKTLSEEQELIGPTGLATAQVGGDAREFPIVLAVLGGAILLLLLMRFLRGRKRKPSPERVVVPKNAPSRQYFR